MSSAAALLNSSTRTKGTKGTGEGPPTLQLLTSYSLNDQQFDVVPGISGKDVRDAARKLGWPTAFDCRLLSGDSIAIGKALKCVEGIRGKNPIRTYKKEGITCIVEVLPEKENKKNTAPIRLLVVDKSVASLGAFQRLLVEIKSTYSPARG